MDSKKLTEMMTKISDYLDNEVLEGIPVVKFKDEAIDFDGIKIDGNLLVQEVDGDYILERMIEIEATKFDIADVFFEEIIVCESVEELLPHIKQAIEDNQEEHDEFAWMDYENDIEIDEESDDDF